MNIGILTFHYAHNYGAVLQAFALKTALEQAGHNVEIINYHNPSIEKCYPYNREKKNLSEELSVVKIKDYLSYNYEILTGDRSWKIQHEKFERWIKNNLNISDKIYRSASELTKLNKDIIICGSDQIWNPYLTNGFDPVYFLDFETRSIRISYAASIGVDKLDRNTERLFFKLLSNFDHITVREDTLKRYINNKYPVEVVQDPVFLLDQKDYLKFARKPKLDRYLLLYSLKEDDRLIRIAKSIAKRRGLKCIELKYFHNVLRRSMKQIAYAGPNEFLGLIACAECVVTNSFHGTAFSMIFNKEFYCVSAGSVNSRISDLLCRFNLEDRMIQDDKVIHDKSINYDVINNQLISEQMKSRECLFYMFNHVK